jgi:formylglycine-generating enzyme required for sulfatase activity
MWDKALLLSNQMAAIEAHLCSLPDTAVESVRDAMRDTCADPRVSLLARISAGNVLGLIGDPRLDPLAPAMCAVPYGPFTMGMSEEEAARAGKRYGIPVAWMRKSCPEHEVLVDAFEIGRQPVTEMEWAVFLRDTGVAERPAHWRDTTAPPYRRSHPVHGVPWHAVLLYTEWLSERTGAHYRVPTEAEWEKAARGTDGRIFPWGSRFEASRCNTREGGVGNTTPVGIYTAGASPWGALDIAGNVEEYTADLYWPYPGSTLEDGDYGAYRITRGGCYALDADLARGDRRHGDVNARCIGFRLARSAADEWLGHERPGRESAAR